MRVSNKMIYGHFAYAYAQRESAIHKLDKQLSSGRRIEKPSDDPFGTARAMNFRTNITEVDQYIENSNRAISWLNITDDALMTVDSNLHRVRELVIAGANASLTNEARKAMAMEIDEISAALLQVANTTIDNRYVFGGEKFLEKAYEARNPVSSNPHDLAAVPINITAGLNDQFNLVVDGNPPVTITLTARNYDGSPTNTLDDLVKDIQTQLRGAGFAPPNLPVNVKVTPEGRLEFYAGTQPPDGTTHTVVLLQQPLRDALPALGFLNEATTKELVGARIDFPVMVMGKYSINGTILGSGPASIDVLLRDAAPAGYYDNWTVMADDNGVVQTRTVPPGFPGGNTIPVSAAWVPPLGPDTKYYLSPPMAGLATGGSATTIDLDPLASSAVADFYTGMPITITDGAGQNQTRKVVAYDPVLRRITVDSPWNIIPGPTSRYAIDPDSHTNANNKFKITIGNGLPQEISMDTGDYSPAAFAQMIENKIRERGGPGSVYDNIRVYMTPENELRIVPRDPLTNNPPTIKLESGSTADGLWLLGFKDGAISNELLPNFEGNKNSIEYEVNVGVKLKINVVGEKLFDPIFKHLAKISLDLRAGNTAALSGEDLRNLQMDLENVLMAQGEIGAKVNRMEKALDRFGVINENLNKLLSNAEDTDITKAILELKMHETAYQAALQSGARIMPMSLLEYLR
ncbi:MAG: flagellar hook-associated protein FlgL [Firmicutes bacterium]|nr:flagellar hook-associated protein FlgL [Bacillota bacterium]